MRHARTQSGQVLVIVAVWMVALIGAASLVLLAGSVEWQRNQLQQLADQAALDAALKIGVGCSAGSANTVITEADNFVASQRGLGAGLAISGASCTAPYTGTDTFPGGLSETIDYPYRLHQQQVEVILTLSLPISFGSYMGATNTTVTRRAVAQQLAGSTTAVSATTLSCTGGQFNVAGSVAASTNVTFAGGCAVYAHARLDPASGTYSDFGNASVYAGSQAWVGGGGTCVAGANAGSSSAVCADGYELSGHVTMSCGTAGTSAFLSAADAAVNANPCAAGKSPMPAPPVSSILPPDPNTDASITATLPGGIACNAGTAYGNIIVNSSLVGTGNATAPTPDPSGYIHFHTGCYGYLDLGNLGSSGSISLRQMGLEDVQADNKVDPTLPGPSAAGTLLVVTLRASDGINKITGPGGSWTLAASAQQAGEGWNQVWYLSGANNPGGITTAEWKAVPGSLDINAQMTEWNGAVAAAPLDQVGQVTVPVATTTAVDASGADVQADDLVVSSNGYQAGAGQTYTAPATYSGLLNDTVDGYGSEYRLNAPVGVQTETLTSGKPSLWSLAMATFKPASIVAAPGAVLDPGFYYFNGIGFAGGGGICLNGGTLLARDVTLEFVNQAGYSSGTCGAGGGAACASATCQFGSTPCSISACPPNAAADAAGGGFTWFAAPCSSAPTGDSAACAGSAWCPVGDRACWNTLVWAPASNTGQIAIKGSSARAWLLGSVFWPGTCTDAVNGTSRLDGTISCGTLSVSAAAGAGIAVGSDYGIDTALVEAELVE